MAETTADIAHRVNRFILDDLLLGKDLDLGGITSFLEAGVIDSTGILELVQFVEESFGISILDTEMVPENLDSLSALVAFVGRKTAGAVAATAG